MFHNMPEEPSVPPQPAPKGPTPQRTVARLALYRRLLLRAQDDGKNTLYSHEIGEALGINPPQVRRDLMEVGYLGHPRHGYETAGLLEKLDAYFGMDKGIRMVLVGVGNLGRAILGYFVGKQSHISLEAAFDADPEKAGRVLCGCRCHPVSDIPTVLRGKTVHVGLIAVPAPEAQKTADLLVAAGVRSLVNFAPARLRVPPAVFVEELDVTLGIEKAAYFAKAPPRTLSGAGPS